MQRREIGLERGLVGEVGLIAEELQAAGVPSSDIPPPGTIMCTCGWCAIAEPQVWSTDVKPILTPRRLGSAAIVRIVCDEALNKRS